MYFARLCSILLLLDFGLTCKNSFQAPKGYSDEDCENFAIDEKLYGDHEFAMEQCNVHNKGEGSLKKLPACSSNEILRMTQSNAFKGAKDKIKSIWCQWTDHEMTNVWMSPYVTHGGRELLGLKDESWAPGNVSLWANQGRCTVYDLENSVGIVRAPCGSTHHVICSSGIKECKNTQCKNGEECYEDGCRCKKGFEVVGDTCKDINECKDQQESHDHKSSVCGQNSVCSNIDGSHACSCRHGFTSPTFNGKNCKDIDECVAGNPLCGDDATCENTIGGSRCRCEKGFNYKDDSHTGCADFDICEDVKMLEEAGCHPNGTCVHWPGGYYCMCPEGMYSDTGDGKNCKDVDECLMLNYESHPDCAPFHYLNGSVSYHEAFETCEGLKMQLPICDQEEVDMAKQGLPFKMKKFWCRWSDREIEGVWENPYNGDLLDTYNVSFRSFSAGDCSYFNVKSNKLSRGACNGHKLASVLCIKPPSNNSECDYVSPCGAHSSCSNTDQGYFCDCDEGFYSPTNDGANCEDIDECKNGSLCTNYANARCNNTIGGYECVCEEGAFGTIGNCNFLTPEVPTTSGARPTLTPEVPTTTQPTGNTTTPLIPTPNPQEYWMLLCQYDNTWICQSQQVIQCAEVCDGTQHCQDGSDEGHMCRYFRCHDSSHIRMSKRCDHKEDCGDGSDEENCEMVWAESCAYGQSIPRYHRCDNFYHCDDPYHSDEYKCIRCRVNYLMRFDKKWIADGIADCGEDDDSDETGGYKQPEKALVDRAVQIESYLDELLASNERQRKRLVSLVRIMYAASVDMEISLGVEEARFRQLMGLPAKTPDERKEDELQSEK